LNDAHSESHFYVRTIVSIPQDNPQLICLSLGYRGRDVCILGMWKTTFVVRPLILRGRHWHLSFWPKTTSWLKLKIKKLIKFSLLKRRNWALITTNFLEKLLVTENIKNPIPRLELDEQVAIFQLHDKAKGLLYSFFFLLQ
jgi:hypothetical protein